MTDGNSTDRETALIATIVTRHFIQYVHTHTRYAQYFIILIIQALDIILNTSNQYTTNYYPSRHVIRNLLRSGSAHTHTYNMYVCKYYTIEQFCSRADEWNCVNVCDWTGHWLLFKTRISLIIIIMTCSLFMLQPSWLGCKYIIVTIITIILILSSL